MLQYDNGYRVLRPIYRLIVLSMNEVSQSISIRKMRNKNQKKQLWYLSLDDQTKPQCCWRAAKIEATRSEESGCSYKGKHVEHNWKYSQFYRCCLCGLCHTLHTLYTAIYTRLCVSVIVQLFVYVSSSILLHVYCIVFSCFKCKPTEIHQIQLNQIMTWNYLSHKSLLSLCSIDVIHFQCHFFPGR